MGPPVDGFFCVAARSGRRRDGTMAHKCVERLIGIDQALGQDTQVRHWKGAAAPSRSTVAGLTAWL